MRVGTFYIILLLAGLTTFCLALKQADSPETAIIGEWQELKWEYEKVNEGPEGVNKKYNSDETRWLAGQHLVIHESEKWTFLPGGKLKLSGKNRDKIVTWSLKGRGHVLELKYDDDMKESYNLTRLNENQMVLNFESDVQVKGIAKLTFEKI